MTTAIHCPVCGEAQNVESSASDVAVRCSKCKNAWAWSSPHDDCVGAGPFHIDDIEVSEEAYKLYWGVSQPWSSSHCESRAEPRAEEDPEDRLFDLLQLWEDSFERGRDIPAAELSRDWPELLPILNERIAALKKMAWVNAPDVQMDVTLASAPTSRRAGEEPIPGYQLIKFLGQGGFGEVWVAVTPTGDRKAIKFVDHKSKRRQEWRGLQRIMEVRHPCVLAIERFEFVNGKLAIVSELGDCSLHDYFERLRNCAAAESTRQSRDGFLQFIQQEAIRLLRDAAEALDCMLDTAHLLHLDVKPTNLLLVNGRCKVGDFGTISRFEIRGINETTPENASKHTVANLDPCKLGDQSFGSKSEIFTAYYAPPEAFFGLFGRTHDQYSLAITYCELISGRIPFKGPIESQFDIRGRGQFSLEFLASSIAQVVARALDPHPSYRFASCMEFVTKLSDAFTRSQVLEKPRTQPFDSVPKTAPPEVMDEVGIDETRISIGSLSVFEAALTNVHSLALPYGKDIVIGRQEGGTTEYLDPSCRPTRMMPGSFKPIASNPAEGLDTCVSRGHFTLRGSPRGIIFINGVPGRAGGIRPPTNWTFMLQPHHRLMEKGEIYLIENGTTVKMRLPNNVDVLISAS